MGRRLVRAAAALLLLAACAATEREAPYAAAPQPEGPGFGAGLPVGGTDYGNDSLADLLVALTFDTEWGDARVSLLKFPGPVRVALEGPGAAQYAGFLDGYLGQLRERAGIDIARAEAATNIQVRFVDAGDFNALLPSLSCVVVPGDLTWDIFASDPRRYGTRASVSGTEPGQTVFIPQSAEPETVRACLIEEIAQGLGPANDLWGLGPTIFNDDAAHLWPTALDYLMLRVLYQPELRVGAGREATRAAARDVLRRLNPGGEGAAPLPPLRLRELARWRDLMQRAHARNVSAERSAAIRAAAGDIVAAEAPQSAQACQSLIGLAGAQAPTEALARYDEAARLCTTVHGPGDIRLARIALGQAGALAALDRPDEVLAATARARPVFAALGQSYGLAWGWHLDADAYSLTARPDLAAAARTQALAWGAYAYGADHRVLAEWRAEWGLQQ